MIVGGTYLLIDALKIDKSVGDIFGVANVVGGDLKIAASAL